MANTRLPGQVIRSGSIPTTALSGGVVSRSAQVNYAEISNIPSGIVSASTQLPSGILSSSTQINNLSNVSASFATTSSAATSITFTPTTASFATTSSFATTAPYSGLTNTPAGIMSSSTQTVANIANQTISPSTITATGAISGSGLATTGNSTIGGNLTVSGILTAASQSVTYISSSLLNVATNIITVNVQNPTIRFGGLAVIDSGSSPQRSGSLLFDSINDQWIFVHQNQTNPTSSVVLMGPQTFNNIGNETNLTSNYLLKSVNAEHVGDSIIYDNGTTVGIGTTNPQAKFHVYTGTTSNITILEGSAGQYLQGGTDGSGFYLEQVGTTSGNRILRIQNSNGSGTYTQLFLHGANQTIYTSANVNFGIGTSSPSYKLDIAGAGSNNVAVRLTPDFGRVRLNGYDLLGYNGGNLWLISNSSVNQLTLGTGWDWDTSCDLYYQPGTTGATAGVLIIGQTNKNSATWTHGITELRTNGTTRLYINSSGNVGIGTTNPSAKLDVYSGTDLGSGANGIRVHRPASYGQYGYLEYLISSDQTVLGSVYTGGGASAYGQIYFRQHSSTTSRTAMVINSSGNIGINTTSPNAELDIRGNLRVGAGSVANDMGATKYVTITTATIGHSTGLEFYTADGTYNPRAWITHTNSSGAQALTFNSTYSTGTGYANFIFSNGNVGIGTTSPASKLHISGVGSNNGLQINTIKTYVTERLSAASTQARRFEIARIGIDYNDWNSVGIFMVELMEYYYSRGVYKRYQVSYGYNNNSYACDLVEYNGTGDNSAQVTVGTPVQVSGDQYYLPVYVDVRYYGIYDVRIQTNRELTTNSSPAIGTTYINLNPSPTNISDFTADSQVKLAPQGGVYIAGNVGIGTTSPSYKLDINSGGIRIDGKSLITANGYFICGAPGFRWNSSDDAYNNVVMYDNGNMYVRGNLGIGTTSPGSKLHVTGSAANGTPLVRFEASSTNTVFDWLSSAYASNMTSGNNVIHIFGKESALKNSGYVGFNYQGNNSDSNFLTFGLYSADNLVNITGAGKVGIATTSPSYKLHVVGDIYANGGDFRVSGNLGIYWETHGGGWFMQDSTWLRTYNSKSIWAGNGQIGTNGGVTVGYGGNSAPSMGAIFSGSVGIGTMSPVTQFHATGLATFNSTGRFAVNGDGFYFGEQSAAYRNPDTNIPAVVIRMDESNAGLDETKAALVLYNANGGLNTGAGMTFASREAVGAGNDVALSGVFGIKETAGTANAWSTGGLRFWTKNQGNITEAMAIVGNGNVGIGTTSPTAKLHIEATDVGIRLQENGTSAGWRGRMGSFNSSADRVSFLGIYASVAGVFAHNHALNAWADLYVNTVDGAGGGTVRMPSSVLINGSQALHAGNYNSYAPTLTGTGASGTWGISITGNAATVTNGMYLSGDQSLSGAKVFNTPSGQTFNAASGNVGLTVFNPAAGDAMMTFHVSGDYAGYFGLGGAENDLVWTGWSVGNNRYRILHSGNYTSWAPSLTGTGASGTWGISISGNAATATTATSATDSTKLPLAGGTMTGIITTVGLVPTGVGGDSGVTSDYYKWGYQESGAWSHPYPDLVLAYHTGMKFGANTGYGGMRFYSDHPHVSSTILFSIGDGDSHVRVANNLYIGGNLALHAGNYTSYAVSTTYNSSLNSDSRNSRGVTRLYRRDNDSDYSVQTYWTGTRWRLYGYSGDSDHADTHVGYADSAGSAGSATSATSATNAGLLNTNTGTANNQLQYWQLSGNSTLNPDTSWWYALRLSHGDADTYYSATIAVDFFNDIIQFRRKQNGTNQTWRTLLHSGNYNSYSPTLSGTGASGTWGISITGNAANITAYTINQNVGTGNDVQFNRIGLGTSPSYDVHISKATSPSIYLQSGNDDSKIYLTDTARYVAGIPGSAIAIYTDSGIRGRYDIYGMRVYGALGIGLTPDSGWTSGEIRASNNITAYSSSDRQLKENIIPLSNALEKISRINGVTFDWTQEYIDTHGGEDGMFIRKHDVGVIAQEIEEVLPEIVVRRDDGYLAVRYEKVVPLLIQAIKELTEKVHVLENK